MPEHAIREATVADAAAIADIYNHYVLTSTATFDTETKSVADREQWLSEHDSRHPVLVVVQGGEVVGWGSLSPWRSRPAYARTVEIATYIADGHRGQGIGRALLVELVERAARAGHHAIVAQITGENAASLALTEGSGFERVGVLSEVGWKFDRWLDVVLLERLL